MAADGIQPNRNLRRLRRIEEAGQIPAAMSDALDAHHVAVDPEQDRMTAHGGHAGIVADVRPQPVQQRSALDVAQLRPDVLDDSIHAQAQLERN